MKYRDLVKLNNGKGIFSYLNEIMVRKENDNTIIFSFIPNNFDLLYTNTSGSKPCNSDIVEDVEKGVPVDDIMKRYASLIEVAYYDQWDSLLNVMKNKEPEVFNLSDYKEVITENIIDTGSDNRQTSNTSTSKVSPYNNETMHEEGKDEDTGSDMIKRDNTHDRMYTRTGSMNMIGNFNKAVEYLKNNYLYDIMFKDVDKLMTLSIYSLDD